MNRVLRAFLFGCALAVSLNAGHAQVTAQSSALFIDGMHTNALRLLNGAKWVVHSNASRLEFTTPLQYAELPLEQSLDGRQELTVGGWFFPRRSGEKNLRMK